MSSHFLNHDLVHLVVTDFVERVIFPLMRSGMVKRSHLAIVVAYRGDLSVEFEDALLLERTYNLDNQPFEHPYDQIAYGKCALAYREGRSTREVNAHRPELLQTGDVVHAGGIVSLGFAIGVSGVDNWDDEAFALQLAVELWRIIMGRYMIVRTQDINFLGEEVNHPT